MIARAVERLDTKGRARAAARPIILRGQLDDDRLPRVGREVGSDRGGKRNPRLLDSTAMLAARTLASGLMADLTSPARPWFVLGLGSPALSSVPEVRAWLDDVQGRMFRVFARSNLYNALAVAYEELAVFGTAALVVTEDAREIVRAYPLTAGEYWLGASERQSVNTLYRTLGMTSFQLVERFGRGAVSVGVRERYDRGEWDHMVEIVHAIEPNEEVRELTVRVRTIGDIISTGLVESPAATVDDIIAEIAAARVTERGSRADDKTSEAAMEDRKREGYF